MSGHNVTYRISIALFIPKILAFRGAAWVQYMGHQSMTEQPIRAQGSFNL